MNTKAAVASAAVAAFMIPLTSGPAAAAVAAKQRVAITARVGVYTFVLTPLKPGAVVRDSGTVTWGPPAQHFVMRNGQKVEINDVAATFAGNRGNLTAQFRIEWLDAGGGYTIGVGTWRLVEGTGDYEGITGSGRSASSWLPRGPVTFRAEGYVTPK